MAMPPGGRREKWGNRRAMRGGRPRDAGSRCAKNFLGGYLGEDTCKERGREEDSDTRHLLDDAPPDPTVRQGSLTCFGGGRVDDGPTRPGNPHCFRTSAAERGCLDMRMRPLSPSILASSLPCIDVAEGTAAT